MQVSAILLLVMGSQIPQIRLFILKTLMCFTTVQSGCRHDSWLLYRNSLLFLVNCHHYFAEKAQGKADASNIDAEVVCNLEVDKMIKAIPVNNESVAKSDEERLQPTAAKNADPNKSAKKRITPIAIN